MSDVAIKVENLSKRYRIGLKEEMHDTFFGMLSSWAKSPVENFRRVRSLSKFDENGKADDIIWALRDVSFEVKYGEVLGIIGRNGAGKSTLLKILCRITEPTSGRAFVNGRVASLLEVGTGFHPELTGRENVYLNGTILGMSKTEIDLKFDEIVDFSGVEKFIDTPVKRYSSGMKVRLAFAVAAHLEPEILLIDEVLAVGDVEFQKKCLGKMGDIAKGGRTVLFVSHNMAAINKLCGNVVLLEGGRIDSIGDAQSIVAKYLLQDTVYTGFIRLKDNDSAVALIKEVGILNHEGKFTSSVHVDKGFFVWISVELKERLDNCQIAFGLYTIDGTVIFASTHTDTIETDELYLLPGRYNAKVKIPCNFLNIGSYILTVRVFGQRRSNTRKNHASAINVIQFRVEDTGSISRKLSDHRGGFITPIFKWTLQNI